MKSRTMLIAILSGALLFLFSCRKDNNDPPNGGETVTSMTELSIAPDFNFETTQDVSLQVTLNDNNDRPLSNVRLEVYTDYPENGGQLILTGVSDGNGKFNTDYRFPAYLDKVVVATPYIGLPNATEAPITNGNIDHYIGGSNQNTKSGIGPPITFKSTMVDFYSMGTK